MICISDKPLVSLKPVLRTSDIRPLSFRPSHDILTLFQPLASKKTSYWQPFWQLFNTAFFYRSSLQNADSKNADK